MGFKALTAVNIKITVLWDVTPCSLVEVPMFQMNLSPKLNHGTSPKIAIFYVINLHSCDIVMDPESLFSSFTDIYSRNGE
jgi:hypothetical protein